MKYQKPTETGLCQALQPDGRFQRCIRFENHPGQHQTFVAEWNEGDANSRRRQTGASFAAPPVAFRRPPVQRQFRSRAH
jgi:hypothetical protein